MMYTINTSMFYLFLVTQQTEEERLRWVFSTKGDSDHQWRGPCVKDSRLRELTEPDCREGQMCVCCGDKPRWVGGQCREFACLDDERDLGSAV